MKRKIRPFTQALLPLFLFLSFVLVPTLASAEDTRESSTNSKRNQSGYIYIFEDDPLDATGQAAEGLQLRVRRLGVRTLLIRARSQFISELIESAESL